ncbi:MAG: hypothetical protein II816_08025 [Elusimicrobia bacterium]|nr:hypothetical protein [Elusimicrobiota bacterium]
MNKTNEINNNNVLSSEEILKEDINFIEEPVNKFKEPVIKTLQVKQNKENFGKTIIPFGAHPEEHEKEIAKILNKYGKDVEFLIPVETKYAKTPDVKMDGQLWEIKSPEGNSNRTIENNLRCALKQSTNIIIDLRRIKVDETKAISQIKKQFVFSKSIRKIVIIKKNSKVLDILR